MARKGTLAWKVANYENCKRELAEMQDNPFLRDIKEIQTYCYEQCVDVGVGLDIYLQKHYPTKEEREAIPAEHIQQYKEMNRKYYMDYIVEVMEA